MLSGPPSGQGVGGGARTHDRMLPADLRVDLLSTEPPIPRRSKLVHKKIEVRNGFNFLRTEERKEKKEEKDEGEGGGEGDSLVEYEEEEEEVEEEEKEEEGEEGG
ncbi:hypothetical protein PoB_005317200 [Plakobranchus ocellatus]|uniref:Uncharacterized protein n=1 Tax=Plakobranchus ocellatus TaxID=259542 RepID=A0AAV4C4Z3_9GAST|nr:hypothetical protein PoB_005317200 [Plakobranchus ocellatus]